MARTPLFSRGASVRRLAADRDGAALLNCNIRAFLGYDELKEFGEANQ
jgi:hypothetical protein